MSLSFTAADVRPLPGAVCVRLQAAGTCTPGDAVYVDSNGDAALADADAAASAMVFGLVVAGADDAVAFVADDYVDVCVFGPVAGFSSLTPGEMVFASTTAGDIATSAPAGSSGDYVYVVGTCMTSTRLFVNPWTYDVTAQ